MSDTFDSVVNHLEAAEVLFKADPKNETVWALLSTTEGAWNTFVKVEEEALQVVAHHPLCIPEEKRAELAELIVRIGPHNNLCRLEMDFDEGRLMIRRRTHFNPEYSLNEEAIFDTICLVVCSLGCAHSAVMAILYQGKTAAEAAQLLESEGEHKQDLPHANRFNLPKSEGNVPWPELPEEGLRRN